jgi:hypothetical protein
MAVAPSQRAAVINGTYHALATAGLGSAVGIMADESSSLSLAEAEYATWLPEALNQVAVLCHHTYVCLVFIFPSPFRFSYRFVIIISNIQSFDDIAIIIDTISQRTLNTRHTSISWLRAILRRRRGIR